MKKIILGVVLIIITCSVHSQNCKYKTNEIDKFTGKFTKITKSETVIKTFYTEGKFSVKKIDTSFFFVFDYVLSSYSDFNPYSINTNAQLIFLLENGDVITLKTDDKINGVKKIAYALPPIYYCYLTNVSYKVSRSEIDKFLKSKVKSIRFYRTESNGKEDYIDNEIKKKNQDDIQDLIKCII